MEKINIAELLKDAPKGTKLYSPICGECTLDDVAIFCDYPISVRVDNIDNYLGFSQFGVYDNSFPDAECLLFPSKNCRSWENFKAPWKHLERR